MSTSTWCRAAVLVERGDYYVVDTRSNNIREHSFDLEAYARKLGVLREGEEVR
jgi:hypothetical protein